MTKVAALLDANVLYPAPLRDLLLQMAVSGLFVAKWTATIHEEWIGSLLRNEPHRNRVALERTRDLMDKAIRDCLVTGYEDLVPQLLLPDQGDRHVLAAAITANCEVIVSYNLRDFPETALDPYGIEAMYPDAFLQFHLSRDPILFCEAAHKVRLRLRHPPFTVEQYLATLRMQGLTETTDALVPLGDLL